MEFNRNKEDCSQQLNTKRCCFLCLDDVEEIKNNSNEDQHLFSIRCLLRHLQIKSFDKQTFIGKDIEVDLCETCDSILNGFTKVLEELEKVKLKMNYFLERISKTISDSKKDSERVQVYSKRMTDDPKALAQLAFVDNLRKELAVKSLIKRVGPIPYIKLRRTKKLPEVKEEDWIEESEGAEVEDFNYEEANIADLITSNSPEHSFADLSQETIEHVKVSEALSVAPLLNSSPEVKFNPGTSTAEEKPKKNKVKKPSISSICAFKNKETGMYHCRKCTKTFAIQTTMVRHYESVHLQKRFKCDICNMSSFTRSFRLVSHKKTCRENLESRIAKEKERKSFQFICDLCGKRFKFKAGLRRHKSDVHQNIKRYPCDLCDKEYTKLCNLNEHKDAIHFGKVFKCRFCSKEFRRKTHLCNHEKACGPKTKFDLQYNNSKR